MGWQAENRNKQSYSICAAVKKYLEETLLDLFPLYGTILTYGLTQ